MIIGVEEPAAKSSEKPAVSAGGPIPKLVFFLFFISGFCGLLYQVVWTRLAFASFGIITPVLSVVLSVFMLGLSLGSWAAGKWIGKLEQKTGIPAIVFYALAECLIGTGAFVIPGLFERGARLLLGAGGMDSLRYLLLSAVVLGSSILPWCVLMGATFPLMMAHLRKESAAQSKSFSFLYVANVLGAVAGTLCTALVLVEMFGFRDTLRVAAANNFLVGACAMLLAARHTKADKGAAGLAPNPSTPPAQAAPAIATNASAPSVGVIPWVLFWTGFSAMAMEVVWMRAFTPVIKTQVYSFALVVATYLAATFGGSVWYRVRLKQGRPARLGELIGLLCITALLPVIVNNPHVLLGDASPLADARSVKILLASIVPFCGVLGYLTPGLVDSYGGGSPALAGRAYAVNVIGCIAGPLVASYLLLPNLSEARALTVLAAPFFALYFFLRNSAREWVWLGLGAGAAAFLVKAFFFAETFEDYLLRTYKDSVVRRDYAASVVSYDEGEGRKQLLVNGIGMTKLTPITKFMVHLPLAFNGSTPRSALIICFGMGTSFRSALSWNVETTAVELVPSVKAAFGFYYNDAPQKLANPNGKIVIDDGRRFLARTREKYDLIVVDPPPPTEAAGSSLLYSKEFYDLAKQRLAPGGIMQAWIPATRGWGPLAAVRSACESFPCVRCFVSVEGWGLHILGSMEPIPQRSVAQLAARMPSNAASDLLEFSPDKELHGYLREVLSREIPVERMLERRPGVRITDDLPYNEYFFLRAEK